jgi:hypothetical protein
MMMREKTLETTVTPHGVEEVRMVVVVVVVELARQETTIN